MTIEQLLDESIEAAQQRERGAFDELKLPADGRLVLFGAGLLGRKILRVIRLFGHEPLGFADSNLSLQGTQVDGLQVYSLGEAVRKWGERALFIISIFHPTADHGTASRLKQLADLGCRWTTSFLPLAWRFPGILPHFGAELPSKILEQRVALGRIAAMLGDKVSRETFRQQLYWRLRGKFSEIGLPDSIQYFPLELIKPNASEVFVDGGAFDGDTLRSIPWGYLKAIAIEPDPVTAGKLRAQIDSRVQVVESALGSRPGKTFFNASGTMAAARSDTGLTEVNVTRLDDLLAQQAPTFIKLDVEGDELSALQGGRETILRSGPVVAVCIYHRAEDLWTLPLFLAETLPSHFFALRIHAYDGFELVAYAVPKDRCLL